MLAVLGFVTILLVLALIMSKKVSTLVALIFVPAITGFIAAFINAPNVIIQAAQAAAEKAGTAYVEPVITFGTRFTKALSILSADYMGKGLSSIVATGVMFIFAILFFSTCSDAGVFDPIINRILKFTGEDPVKVCIGTFLIGCICHLDGSGATTFLIAIPACMPLFQKLKMNLWVEATIVALAAGIMNVMPWGGPTVRAAAAMSGLGYEVTGSELWVGIMPAWIAGLVTCLLIAAFLGKKEAKRIAAGIPAQEVTGLTEAKTTNTSNELARSGWRWYFNVALILVILYILVTNRLSPAVTFYDRLLRPAHRQLPQCGSAAQDHQQSRTGRIPDGLHRLCRRRIHRCGQEFRYAGFHDRRSGLHHPHQHGHLHCPHRRPVQRSAEPAV